MLKFTVKTLNKLYAEEICLTIKSHHEKPSPNTKCSGEDSKLFSYWKKGKDAISPTYSLAYTVQKARLKQLDKKNKQKAFKVMKRYS